MILFKMVTLLLLFRNTIAVGTTVCHSGRIDSNKLKRGTIYSVLLLSRYVDRSLKRSWEGAVTYRICDSQMTMEIILSTLVNPDFVQKSNGILTINAYFSYLDQTSTAIAKNLLSSENVYFIDFNVTLDGNFKNLFDLHKRLTVLEMPNTRVRMDYFVKKYSWRNIVFVNIYFRKKHDINLLYFRKKYPDMCISRYDIMGNDTQQIKNVVNHLERKQDQEVIFVSFEAVDPDTVAAYSVKGIVQLLRLIDNTHLSKKIWFFNEFILFTKPQYKDIIEAFKNLKYLQGFFRYSDLSYNSADVAELMDVFAFFLHISESSFIYYSTIIARNYINGQQKGVAIRQQVHNSQNVQIYWGSNNTKPLIAACPRISCGSGFESKILLQKNSTGKSIFDWNCVNCKLNYIKKEHSDNDCRKCPPPHISDKYRVSCLDPFNNIYLHYSDKSSVIVLVIMTLGISFGIFIIYNFIKHKHTPVVRAANYKLSLIQLVSHCLLFAVVPFLQLGKPILWKCKIRHAVLGLLLATICSITFAKTQKLIYIFHSKVLFSRKEKIITTFIDIVIIAVIVLVQVLISITTLLYYPPKINAVLDKNNMSRSISCNTDFQLHIQLIYSVSICIMCALRSFRARTLPSCFSETRFISYSTFTFSLVILCTFPVYYTRQDVALRTAVNCITISCASLLMLLVTYGYKMFIIYLRPDKNTSSAFNTRLQKHALQEIDKNLKKREGKASNT